MGDRINAYCGVCGKGYHMCLACKSVMESAPWKTDTDTAEHYKIFQILYGNSTGVYTDKEAREKLLNVDLSDMYTFKDNVKAHIKRLIDMQVDDVNSAVDVVEESTEKNEKTQIIKDRVTEVVEKADDVETMEISGIAKMTNVAVTENEDKEDTIQTNTEYNSQSVENYSAKRFKHKKKKKR